MKILSAPLFAVSAVLALAATAHAFTLPPPDPGTTVYITACGTQPQVTVGSSPFFGSVLPDVDTTQCRIYFDATPDPFEVIVDGSTPGPNGDYVAPICNVRIEGPRTKYTVAITAAGIHAMWDYNIVEPVVPPQLVSWVCYYPWPPTADGQTGLRHGLQAAPAPRTSAR